MTNTVFTVQASHLCFPVFAFDGNAILSSFAGHRYAISTIDTDCAILAIVTIFTICMACYRDAVGTINTYSTIFTVLAIFAISTSDSHTFLTVDTDFGCTIFTINTDGAINAICTIWCSWTFAKLNDISRCLSAIAIIYLFSSGCQNSFFWCSFISTFL